MDLKILEKIHTRGYWEVIIRPFEFKKDRIADISKLVPLLEKNNVRLRGWSFPFVDIHNKPHVDIDWVSQDLDWDHHLQSWKIFQSGLFAYVSGFWVDWRDQSSFFPASKNWRPNSLFGVADTLFFFTEVFEFAARLSLSEAGDESMVVSIKACNLKDRKLYLDDAPMFGILQPYVASIEAYPYEKKLTKQELIADSKEQALMGCCELFKRFNWNVSIDELRNVSTRISQR